jgi:N-acetylglucosaminyl-diphospho-decaprenol L-rhamnosyltransferase
VVIVTHFSADHLAACLASIPTASETPTPTIIVDNETTDSSVRDVASAFPGVRFIDAGGNLGYGRAVNVAASALPDGIDWILVTNPDTVFAPGSIDVLREVAESDPSIGSVGPRILNADGSVYPSARALPSLRTGIGHALFARAWPSNPWTARYLRSDVYRKADASPAAAGWLSGAAVLVRRAAFEQIGGFDPRFFMYFEDVDLGKSLGEAGWMNIYAPTASVEHAGGESTKRYSGLMLRVHHRSAYLYLAKKYRQWYLWPLRVTLRIGLSLRSRLMR